MSFGAAPHPRRTQTDAADIRVRQVNTVAVTAAGRAEMVPGHGLCLKCFMIRHAADTAPLSSTGDVYFTKFQLEAMKIPGPKEVEGKGHSLRETTLTRA